MRSFGFRLPILIFAVVAALGQTTPSPPASPKSVPANAYPGFDVATIKPGESGTKQWKFAVVSIRKNNSGGPQHGGVATADGYQMKHIGEFQSISFHHPLAVYFEVLLVAGLATAFWYVSRRDFTPALLIFGWAHLSLISGRNIPLFREHFVP